MSKAIKILQVLGPQGSRDPGSIVRFQGFEVTLHGPSVLKGTKGPYVSGFQGIEGFPMLSRAFKGFDVFKIQRFQGGLKGESPRFS